MTAEKPISSHLTELLAEFGPDDYLEFPSKLSLGSLESMQIPESFSSFDLID